MEWGKGHAQLKIANNSLPESSRLASYPRSQILPSTLYQLLSTLLHMTVIKDCDIWSDQH